MSLAQTVRAEGGVTIGELDHESQAFGLAVPMGLVTETGIAGLTLAGGIGWLRRKYGLSCDNLVSADVVTANGELVTASGENNTLAIWQLGGALSRIPPQNTAFGDRSAPYLIGIEANWDGRTRTRTQYASNGEGRSFVRSSHFPVIASTSTSPACMKTGTNPSGIPLVRT